MCTPLISQTLIIFLLAHIWARLFFSRKYAHLRVEVLQLLVQLHFVFVLIFLSNLEEIVKCLVFLKHLLIPTSVPGEVESGSIDAVEVVNIIDLWLMHEFVF